MEFAPVRAIPVHEVGQTSPGVALIPAPSPDCRDWQQAGGLWRQQAPPAFLHSTLRDLKQRSPAAETQILVQRLIAGF